MIWPRLLVLRTAYPDLAGVLMRDWEREGLLVRYRHDRRDGFVLVAVWPRWRWVSWLIFRYWSQWPSLAATARVVVGVVGCWLLSWFLFGAGR